MVIDFIRQNWIEIIGVIISLLYLFFSIQRKIWLWPFGLLSALIYLVVYFQSKFYADMGLQLYYVIISIYGWVLWSRGSSDTKGSTKQSVTRLARKHSGWVLLVFGLIWAAIYLILSKLTDSDVPLGDSFTTAGGIIATWMLAKKMIEHWLFWILIDMVSMGLYIYKGLFPTTLLFGVYTIMAVIGYLAWRKELIRR